MLSIPHIEQLEQEGVRALMNAAHMQELEAVRITFLGRQGRVAVCMTQLSSLSVDDKRVIGPRMNELKQILNEAYQTRKKQLEEAELQQKRVLYEQFDVTAYKKPIARGSQHLYTQITRELEDIFLSMGYEIVDGPEVENDYYNFTALNIPEDHPARDMQDTFWLNVPHLLMRTHTSNVQVRAMENRKPPFALYSSGRVYRNEATDASHDFMFRQGELLVVDKKASMAQLLATAKTFLRTLFRRSDLEIRVRPGYFPFVEPGVEIDATCLFCESGCSVCKKTGWIELLGAGMVHPQVLERGGVDPEQFSGFALGVGLARVAMLRHGINDIRLFETSHINFLRQF